MSLTNPTLAFEFARTKKLPSIVNFVRASLGTYTDNSGILRYAAANEARFDHTPSDGTSNGLLIEEGRTNYVIPSNDFTHANWTVNQNQVYVLKNAGLAPDGSYTASQVNPSSSNVGHWCYFNAGNLGTSIATVSIFAKANPYNYIRVVFATGIGGTDTRNSIIVDLTTGAITQTNTKATPTNVSTQIIPYPNGWWRICITMSMVTGNTYIGFTPVPTSTVAVDGNTDPTFSGSDGLGCLVWGAQVEIGAFATSYIPSADTFTSRASTGTYIDSATGLVMTTPTNLLTYSQDFTNAAWTKGGIKAFSSTGSLANIALAPDGTLTASKIIEDTANTSHHVETSFSSIVGQVYTFSIYVKAGERNNALFNFGATANPTATYTFATVDLSAGTISATTSAGWTPSTCAITSVGYGWYRVSLTAIAQATTTYVDFQLRNNALANAYTGDGTSGLYIWGAQVNIGPLQTYVPTTTSQVTAGGQRYDFNPYTKVNRGIGGEISSTNIIPNSNFAAGWTLNQVTTTTNQASPDGSYTAIKLNDNTTNIEHYTLATLSGGTGFWSGSVFAKVGEREFLVFSIDNGVSLGLSQVYNLATGTVGTPTVNNADFVYIGSGMTPVGNGWYRCWLSIYKGAASSLIRPVFYTNNSFTANSVTYAGTGGGIYLWGAQLEYTQYPTSYIPTYGSTVTRAVDTWSSAAATRSPDAPTVAQGTWLNPLEGSIYATGNIGSGAFPYMFGLSDKSGSNRIILYRAASPATAATNFEIRVDAAGSNQAAISVPAATNSIAAAWKANDIAESSNGAAVSTDVSATIPNVTTLGIGWDGWSGNYANGTINKLYYFPKRLTNTDLQNLSGLS